MKEFPQNYSVLVAGPTGIGKFEYCLDLVKHYLEKGEKVVFITTKMASSAIRDRMVQAGLKMEDYEKDLIFIDASSEPSEESKELFVTNPANLNMISINLSKAVQTIGSPVRVIFDSLSALFLHVGEGEIKNFVRTFSSRIKKEYGFIIYTLQDEMHSSQTVNALNYLVDAVIEMRHEEAHVRKRKFRVLFAKGIEHNPDWFEFDVGVKGFVIKEERPPKIEKPIKREAEAAPQIRKISKPGDISFLLDKAHEHLDKAVSFENTGNTTMARDQYLKASEYLFKSAKGSTGRLKEVRIRNAENLLNKANRLKVASDTGEELEKKPADWTITEKPKVSFKDVAGLDDVKEEIKNKLIYPYKYPEKAEKFGVKSGGGILLHGPPGTGKTFIAKAVANEVDAVFFSVKPSEIMSKWVGEAEQNIEKLFSAARKCDKAVIFIDEVDALIPKRRSSGSSVMQRVVPQILAELEGIDTSNENLLFIGATNEPWSIDPAALRPGRFDEKVYVPPPDFEARKRIFELNLKDKPLSEDIDFAKLAELTNGYSGADIRQICLKASVIPFREFIETGEERKITMEDFLKVFSAIKPSINENMIEKYLKFKF